jgi:hypothetical protein
MEGRYFERLGMGRESLPRSGMDHRVGRMGARGVLPTGDQRELA